MARKERQKKEKNHQTRDYIVFFICAFILIFLTSSFVIENIYNSADKISVSSEGVREIYLAATGSIDLDDSSSKSEAETNNEQNTNDQSTESVQQSAGDK